MMFAKFDPENIPDIIRCGPMRLGKCYVEDVIGVDPYQEIRDFSGDVLIVHGTKDKIVNIEYSKHAYEIYLKSKEEHKVSGIVRFFAIGNGGHGFSKKYDKEALVHLKKFLAAGNL